MSATASGETEQITNKIMTDGDREEIAKEAAGLIRAKQVLSLQFRNFQQRAGATPEDIVLTFGMDKLQNKIIQ